MQNSNFITTTRWWLDLEVRKFCPLDFNRAYIVFLGIQYVVPALLAYTSRKATAKAIGIGVTNHHRSWFKSTFWVVLVNVWAIGCIVLVTWNHIQSAINKGQLWKKQKNPNSGIFLLIWFKKWFIQWFLLSLFYITEYNNNQIFRWLRRIPITVRPLTTFLSKFDCC